MPTGQSSSRVIWDDAAEKHLLILIVLQSQPSVNWNLVAEKFGHGVTPGALMQKYQKIRKRDAAVYHMEDASSSNTTTPRSNKRKSKHTDDMDDEELMEETPTKKKGKTEKAKKMKKESAEYAESEETTVKLDGYEEDDFEIKSEANTEL